MESRVTAEDKESQKSRKIAKCEVEVMAGIDEMVKELPFELQREVEHFVQSLLEKHKRKRGRKLRQDWAGALRDYRDQYTSMELQKKALEWRSE